MTGNIFCFKALFLQTKIIVLNIIPPFCKLQTGNWQPQTENSPYLRGHGRIVATD